MKIYKSKVAGMTDLQYTKRMQLIKRAAAKFENKKKVEARRWTNTNERSRKTTSKFDKELARLDENHNHWTDGSKYLQEHYGERVADQRDYDNDWN
jgi:ribosome-binding protein aMBF1 (putative translation factor)